MIQGLFNEVSEEEMVLTIGGSCAGGCNPYAAPMICSTCVSNGNSFAKAAIVGAVGGAITGGVAGAVVGFVSLAITSNPAPHSSHAN